MRVILLVVVFKATLFLTPSTCCGQIISETDQQKINAVNAWLQQQIQEGKTPTPAQMDSVNKAVNELFKNPAAKADTASAPDHTGTLITKHCTAGGSITVPEDKTWKVKRIFVTESIGGYNVLVTSVKHDKPLHAGEKLTAPSWSAESSLIAKDGTTVSYIFEIQETEVIR